MIGTLAKGLPMAWAIARIAAPGATTKIVRTLTRPMDEAYEDQLMADNLNAFANMATAYQSYRARAERSEHPAVVSARRRLGEVMRQDQVARAQMVRRKIAEGAEQP